MGNWRVSAMSVVIVWYVGFLLVPRSWLDMWTILPWAVPIAIVAAMSVLAWIAKTFNT